jgi:tRNA/rRNA methyltransferase
MGGPAAGRSIGSVERARQAGGTGCENAPSLPAPLVNIPDPTRFVLVGTSHAGNVGATARAMRVMGFTDLVLVSPRTPGLHREAEALARASNALDVLAGVREVATLGEALEGITTVCATAMTPRDFGPPTFAPRERLPGLAADGERVAFVFGGERHGMRNEDVYRCHLCLSIPTDPAYGSLNLAQAVQILAYEWRQALGGFPVEARTAPAELADAAAVQGVVDHWERMLVAIGFLDPAAPKRLMPRLHQLFHRAKLRREEIDILRGIARAAGEGKSDPAPAGKPPNP